MIRDGLTGMYGGRSFPSTDHLEAVWAAALDRQASLLGGFPNRPGETTVDEIDEATVAYVSDNRWVADCPRCGGGVGCTPGYSRAACYDCGGIITGVSWPAQKTVSDGTAALMLRPIQNRHWRPMDETPQDLRFENIVRGFAIPNGGG